MKYNQIFFSPHLDDAVLSCGGLIASLKDQNSTLIVTIFTGADYEGVSEYGRRYIKYCGFKNSINLFRLRKKEERKVAMFLNYDTLFLDFPEAVFRFQKKIFIKNFFYNNKKELFGKINKKDRLVRLEVEGRIKDIVIKNSPENGKVYFPLAIGKHVDHQIISQIGLSFLKKKTFKPKNILFYEDFPYLIQFHKRSKLEKKLQQKGLELKKVLIKKKHLSLKYKSILTYKSQIECLFKSQSNFRKIFYNFYKKPYEYYWHFIQA